MKSKQLKLFLFCIPLAVFLSCFDKDHHTAWCNEVEFHPFIDGQLTRTTNGGDEWEAGDETGIYMALSGGNVVNGSYKNYRYVISPGLSTGQDLLAPGNKVDSSIYFPTPFAPVTVVAYYPYNPGISGGILPVDISAQQDQEALDVLYASKSIPSYNATQPVDLPFSHKMTKLRLTISIGKGMKVSLANAKARLDGIPCTASLNLANGLLEAYGAPASITPKNMGVPAGQESDSAAFQCIIIPHDEDTFDERKVIIAAEGKIYIWNFPDKTDFEENKVYTYHLILSDSKVVEFPGPIKPWEEESDEWAEAAEGSLQETGETNLILLADGSLMPTVYIRGGSFWMGSLAGEAERTDSCEGRHSVKIAQDFLLGQFEVTNSQFASFLNAKGINGDGKGSDSFNWIASNSTYGLVYSAGQWKPVTGKENYPVPSVSWYGAKAFTDWAGNGCRLPTEAEWEYACRAGTQTAFFFGPDSTDIAKYVWYKYTVSNKMPESVGKKDPNNWKLYDMCGNLFELCLDNFAANYSNPPIAAQRVLRGGSFDSTKRTSRSAYRFHIAPGICHFEVGFRVAFDVPGL